MPVARRAPRAGRLAATAGTVAVVAVFYVLSYGDATGTFFSADDYWVMADAADVHMRGPLDVVQFFVPGHNGFALYRPLSTVAYFYVLHGLFGYDPAGYHAAQLTLNVIDAALVYAIAKKTQPLTKDDWAVIGSGNTVGGDVDQANRPAPPCNNACTRNIAGDSRMSSVPPLKARPSTPRRLPRRVQRALRTLRRKRWR